MCQDETGSGHVDCGDFLKSEVDKRLSFIHNLPLIAFTFGGPRETLVLGHKY